MSPKIYTKTGDKGETGLWGGQRVLKNDPRVAAYGDVDELNSCLGCAIAATPLLNEALGRIQKELFTVGAVLATPSGKKTEMTLPDGAVAQLEKEIDALTADLRPMTKFILPGGGAPGAWLHLARTVCRRAERGVVALGGPRDLIVYLNRLSDYLFTAARWLNAEEGRGEVEWEGSPKKP